VLTRLKDHAPRGEPAVEWSATGRSETYGVAHHWGHPPETTAGTSPLASGTSTAGRREAAGTPARAVREWTEKVTPEQQWSIAPEREGRRGRRDRRDPLYDEALRP
jgi:hypothetical protein